MNNNSCKESNLLSYCTCCISPKCETSLRGLSTRHYTYQQHRYFRNSKECCSVCETLATLRPIYLARDIQLRPLASETNALTFDYLAGTAKIFFIIMSSAFYFRTLKAKERSLHFWGEMRLLYFNVAELLCLNFVCAWFTQPMLLCCILTLLFPQIVKALSFSSNPTLDGSTISFNGSNLDVGNDASISISNETAFCTNRYGIDCFISAMKSGISRQLAIPEWNMLPFRPNGLDYKICVFVLLFLAHESRHVQWLFHQWQILNIKW